MRLSKNLFAVAILTGSISSVLSALNYTQMTDAVQDLTNLMNNATSDANEITLGTSDLDT